MIIVGQVYISDDIADELFVCDLEKCKGACCVEGDLGAPLEESEIDILDEIYPKIKPYLTKAGIKAIEKDDLYQLDEDGDFSTTTVNGKECAYARYDEKGVLKCGIEEAYLDGVTDFRKPVSCHLYPARITKYDMYEAVNYHRWSICAPACRYGQKTGVPLYKFLKTPLVRKYGEAWYNALEKAIKEKFGNKTNSIKD